MNLFLILSFLSLVSLMNVNQAMFPSFGSDFINEDDDTILCTGCGCMKPHYEVLSLPDANICYECLKKELTEAREERDKVATHQTVSPQSIYQESVRSLSPERLAAMNQEPQANDNIAQQLATESQQQIYCSVNRKALVLLAVVAAAGTYYVGKKIWHKFKKPAQNASPAEDK